MNQFSPAEQEKLQKLVAAFLEKNTQINLSAIRDEKGTWNKHVWDSLAGKNAIEKYAAKKKKVLDFGSGGGFPALPLAIFFPKKIFFPLDSVGKKMRAVAEIAEQSEIENIEILTGRGEELARKVEYREEFDVVVSRAAAPWPILLEIATPFLKKDGIFISYRGPENDKTDIPLAKKMGLKIEKIEKYELEGGEKRTLWIFTKRQNSATKYPREVGTPKKKPITLSSV